MIEHGISVIPHLKFIALVKVQKSMNYLGKGVNYLGKGVNYVGKGVDYVGNEIKLTVT